jgi:hypothetical protein
MRLRSVRTPGAFDLIARNDPMERFQFVNYFYLRNVPMEQMPARCFSISDFYISMRVSYTNNLNFSYAVGEAIHKANTQHQRRRLLFSLHLNLPVITHCSIERCCTRVRRNDAQ